MQIQREGACVRAVRNREAFPPVHETVQPDDPHHSVVAGYISQIEWNQLDELPIRRGVFDERPVFQKVEYSMSLPM